MKRFLVIGLVIFVILCTGNSFAADSKITALPTVTVPAGTDAFAAAQGGVSKQETLSQVSVYVAADSQTLTNKIINAASNTISGLGASNFPTADPMRRDAIEYIIDGGGVAITTGSKGYLEAPYASTIIRGSMLCNGAGSIIVAINKSTYSGFPTTSSIVSSAPLTIASAQKVQDSTLTGWTTSISAGDILEFIVNSAATVTRCTVSLVVQK